LAEDVVLVDDDAAQIDADAELDAALLWDIVIAQCHFALQRGCAAHRIDDAGDLDQEPVAGRFDDAAAMLGNLGSDTSRRSPVKGARVPFSSSPIGRE
jgi:hypothetical protein